jgi:hypothetical protein
MAIDIEAPGGDEADLIAALVALTGGGEEIISSTTTSGNAASVTVNPPSGYRHLKLRIFGRSSKAGGDIDDTWMQLNGDSGSNYQWERQGTLNGGTGYTSGSTSATQAMIGNLPGATATAGYPGFIEIDLPFYANTTWKKVGWSKNTGRDASGIFNAKLGWSWNNTVITSIMVKPDSSNYFIDGTIVELVGIR